MKNIDILNKNLYLSAQRTFCMYVCMFVCRCSLVNKVVFIHAFKHTYVQQRYTFGRLDILIPTLLFQTKSLTKTEVWLD